MLLLITMKNVMMEMAKMAMDVLVIVKLKMDGNALPMLSEDLFVLQRLLLFVETVFSNLSISNNVMMATT